MASASNLSVNQHLTLVLMGRTGNGKSSTGNSILGRKAFHSTKSFESVTKESKMEQCTCEDGRVLNVIDTPDLFDKNASKEFLREEVFKCIELAKDGIHGVLYVLSTKSRFTEQEANVLDSLELELGPKILNYIVVVFTSGDDLESDGLTLQDYLNKIPQKLKDILHRCSMRMLLFDNKTTSEEKKEKQRSELLKEIDSIINVNNGRLYSKQLFNETQESIEINIPQKQDVDSVEESSIEKREKEKPEQLSNEELSTKDEIGNNAGSQDLVSILKEIKQDVVTIKETLSKFCANVSHDATATSNLLQ